MESEKLYSNEFEFQENLLEGNKNIKTIFLIIIIIFLVCSSFKKAQNTILNTISEESSLLDTISLEELNKARNSFKQYIYQDNIDSTKYLSYNLFIPEIHSENKKYPLVVFIGDSRMVGKETTAPITYTIGGPIWATDTVQNKNKCFVLVPSFNEIIIDNRNGYLKNDYINVTIRLISFIKGKYENIDSKRIYGTGQSMGAMTILYILANYPNLFTAGLVVSGQWKKEELFGLINSTFTYIVSIGDEKSFEGQKEIKKYINNNNIKYGSINNVNARENINILEAYVRTMYSLGYKHNFISYTKGSVFSSKNKTNNEHLESFKYGYRLESVRDWLFLQKRSIEKFYKSKDGRQISMNFCDISKEDNTCMKCIEGFFLSKDKLSCSNDKNCEYGDKDTGLCNSCSNNYYLDIKKRKCKSNLEKEKYKFCKVVNNGICIKCDNFHYLDNENNCAISDNCAKSKDGLCSICENGFYLGLDFKCSDVKRCIYSRSNECVECEDGYYYDRVNRTCKHSKGNFEHCKYTSALNKKKCSACKDNYYLSLKENNCFRNTDKGPFYKCQISYDGRKCQFCVKGYFLGRIDSKCNKIEGCLRSENENNCLECDNDYCLDKNGNCINNYYIIEKEKKYYFRCKSLNENGNGCGLCENDLTPNKEGLCYDEIHCDKKENEVCVKCQKEHQGGYYSYCLNKDFGCIDSFLKNCIRCDDIFNLDQCTKCEEGFEVDNNGYCIKKKL